MSSEDISKKRERENDETQNEEAVDSKKQRLDSEKPRDSLKMSCLPLVDSDREKVVLSSDEESDEESDEDSDDGYVTELYTPKPDSESDSDEEDYETDQSEGEYDVGKCKPQTPYSYFVEFVVHKTTGNDQDLIFSVWFEFEDEEKFLSHERKTFKSFLPPDVEIDMIAHHGNKWPKACDEKNLPQWIGFY